MGRGTLSRCKQGRILQIDIEGAEYRNLLITDSITLNRFRIIVIELHGLRKFKNLIYFQRSWTVVSKTQRNPRIYSCASQ